MILAYNAHVSLCVFKWSGYYIEKPVKMRLPNEAERDFEGIGWEEWFSPKTCGIILKYPLKTPQQNKVGGIGRWKIGCRFGMTNRSGGGSNGLVHGGGKGKLVV
jgi:hypothetical protein